MNVKIEYQVIGSLLIDESTHTYIDNLNEIDFYDIFCRKCFNSMATLRGRDEEITMFNINNLSNIGLSELAKLSGTIATTANFESHIKTLKEQSARRQLLAKAEIIKEMALDNTRNITQIKNDALEEIQNVQEVTNNEVSTLKQAMLETHSILSDRYNSKDDRSLCTGLTKLDSVTAGLHKEELTVIASRPGVGKTILGVQIALNIARNKKNILFVSLEMSTSQICERIIASNSEIDGNRLRVGDIREDEWQKIQRAASQFSYENFILDKTSRNIQHIRTKIRKYKPDLVIIDYLQLLQSVNREQSREREVAVITRDLKLMTLEFKIPIVILSQLNRDADSNRPTLANLRESGAIEQDSDNVIFLHEPKDAEIAKLITKGTYPQTFFDYLFKEKYRLSYIIIEKQRNGAVGTIPVIKRPKYMNFKEVE